MEGIYLSIDLFIQVVFVSYSVFNFVSNYNYLFWKCWFCHIYHFIYLFYVYML